MDPTEDYTDWECRQLLRELYDGRSVVLPCDENHAKFMLLVAQRYLEDRHQQTFNALAKEYQT